MTDVQKCRRAREAAREVKEMVHLPTHFGWQPWRPRQQATLTAAAVLALMLTACTSSSKPADTPSPPSSAATGSSASPSPTSASSASAATGAATVSAPASSTKPAAKLPLNSAALTTEFRKLAAGMKIPGAAMLIRTPGGEIKATFGVTTLGGKTPVSLEDHFRIGSNTKTWTGTVILQLVQDGKIKLSDPVSKYRPDVPNGQHITIEQLLNMRSGLFNYTETYQLNHTLDVDPGKAWDPEELVKMGLALPPYFAPGDGYHYSNTNTVLLGRIAEKIEGKSLQQIFRQRLFTPLGLKQTSFPAADDASLPAPFTHGYMYTDNVRTLAESKLPADLLAQATAGTLLPNDQTAANPSWGGAAGAGISTIGDLATWVQALVGGGLLSPALQRQRLQSMQPTAPSSGAAYGWGDRPDGPAVLWPYRRTSRL